MPQAEKEGLGEGAAGTISLRSGGAVSAQGPRGSEVSGSVHRPGKGEPTEGAGTAQCPSQRGAAHTCPAHTVRAGPYLASRCPGEPGKDSLEGTVYWPFCLSEGV